MRPGFGFRRSGMPVVGVTPGIVVGVRSTISRSCQSRVVVEVLACESRAAMVATWLCWACSRPEAWALECEIRVAMVATWLCLALSFRQAFCRYLELDAESASAFEVLSY